MNSSAELFSEILSEKGVDATVAPNSQTDFSSRHTDVMVVKRVGTKKWGMNVRLPDRSMVDNDDVLYTRLERNAEEVKKQIESATTEEYIWRDMAVLISKYDGGWVECMRCEGRISFQGIANSKSIFSEQELGTPHSFPQYRDDIISDLEGNEKVLFDLYMIGVMERHSCNCPTNLLRGKLSKDL